MGPTLGNIRNGKKRSKHRRAESVWLSGHCGNARTHEECVAARGSLEPCLLSDGKHDDWASARDQHATQIKGVVMSLTGF